MKEFSSDYKLRPKLDPSFLPAVLWNKAYQQAVKDSGRGENLIIALERPQGAISRVVTRILPHSGSNIELNLQYVERMIKSLLWIKGGFRLIFSGPQEIAAAISSIYSPSGSRAFDHAIMSEKIYGHKLDVTWAEPSQIPAEKETSIKLGGNWNGCRIGFDLGGSDRKCAAVLDGKVIYTEEIPWDPYFQSDPLWHKAGIQDSLTRAAAKLPRVDAIGGSAAGVYIDNKVKVASLFRGVSRRDFKEFVAGLFLELQSDWDNIPMVVVNDGEVTALAGAAAVNDSAVLGISMGTSQAAGYVNPRGNITDWLNELAFVPIDFRTQAPRDEWSGDLGCGVQYFSQQAVARLAPAAGFNFPQATPLPEQLEKIQESLASGDSRAADIFLTIGAYFAYAIAYYSDFYKFSHLLVLGRVSSGEAGNLIISTAGKVLAAEFPELAAAVKFFTLDEKNKRHGQAVAAAGLPLITKNGV